LINRFAGDLKRIEWLVEGIDKKLEIDVLAVSLNMVGRILE